MKKNDVEAKAETPGVTKVILTIKDRLMFAELFPEKGNILTQVLVKDIAEKIHISKEEGESVKLVQKGGSGFTWDAKLAKSKDVEFTQAEVRFLKDQVDRLDRDGSVTRDSIETVLKIKDLK